MNDVLLVPTGLANIGSVRAAFERLGARVSLATCAQEVREAARVVLPGVGAFGAGMARLHELDLVADLRARFAEGRATLAVCLGLQLLGESSEESPGIAGLGVFRGCAQRFPLAAQVPQMGWNSVQPEVDARLARAGYAYFANTYRLTAAPAGWTVSWSEHGGERFVAAAERDALLACQFHPELSGDYGQALLGRWMEGAAQWS